MCITFFIESLLQNVQQRKLLLLLYFAKPSFTKDLSLARPDHLPYLSLSYQDMQYRGTVETLRLCLHNANIWASHTSICMIIYVCVLKIMLQESLLASKSKPPEQNQENHSSLAATHTDVILNEGIRHSSSVIETQDQGRRKARSF